MYMPTQSHPYESREEAASITRRFFAVCIDGIVYSIALFWFAILCSIYIRGEILRVPPANMTIVLVITIVMFGSPVAAFVKGTTLGHAILRMHVITVDGGQRAGFLRMLGREVLGKSISSLFFGLGYFWALWDERKLTWHDKIFGTYVVRNSKR
jgi:uncharacterized RDD family membrane protein YckC